MSRAVNINIATPKGSLTLRQRVRVNECPDCHGRKLIVAVRHTGLRYILPCRRCTTLRHR